MTANENPIPVIATAVAIPTGSFTPVFTVGFPTTSANLSLSSLTAGALTSNAAPVQGIGKAVVVRGVILYTNGAGAATLQITLFRGPPSSEAVDTYAGITLVAGEVVAIPFEFWDLNVNAQFGTLQQYTVSVQSTTTAGTVTTGKCHSWLS
jgi:hypothetical protein